MSKYFVTFLFHDIVTRELNPNAKNKNFNKNKCLNMAVNKLLAKGDKDPVLKKTNHSDLKYVAYV